MPTEKRQRQRENRQSKVATTQATRRKAAQRRRIIIGGGGAIIAAGLIFYLSSQSSGKSTKLASTPTSAPTSTKPGSGPPKAPVAPAGASIKGPTPCPKPDGSSPRTTSFAQSPPLCINPAKTYTATFDTTAGKIVVALDTKRTPLTANNLVVLARYHYYDKTSFDRIDTSIDIIQGGSPTTQSISDPGPGYTIKDEGGKFSYSAGDLVMARSSGPDSGSAQYFFVTGPQASSLNTQGTYVTFAKTTQGLSVLQQVQSTFVACDPTDTACIGGGPNPAVIVNGVTITES